MREDKLAKGMFIGGCFGLPLLWFFNVLYFRQAVFGPMPYLDSGTVGEGEDARASGIPDGIPNFGALGMSTSGSDSDDDSGGDGKISFYL